MKNHDNSNAPTSANTFFKVGTDKNGQDLFQSGEALEFERKLAAENGSHVKPSGQQPPSNVGGVAILLPPGTAN